MGKAQKKKGTRHRHNPIRVPDSHLPPGLAAANASAASSKRDAIIPIMQKLEGTDPTERAWASASVSNLIHNDPSTRRLLQSKNVVGVLITRLADEVDEVVVEASGALRNLAIDGGFDICAEMYNKQIMTPIQNLVSRLTSTLYGVVTNPETAEALSSAFQLSENLVTLIWCLSETSNKALNTINNMALVPFLTALISQRAKFPPKLVVAGAQCLYVLTDDNTPAVEAVHSETSFPGTLLSIARTDSVESTFMNKSGTIELAYSLRVLSCGILKNVSPLPSRMSEIDLDLDRTVILPLFIPILGVDLNSISTSAYALASKPTTAIRAELKHAPGSDDKTADEKELDRLESQLMTVQLCLEIITGVCANLPDYLEGEGVATNGEELELDEVEEEGDDSGDDDMMDADAEPAAQADANSPPPKIPDSSDSSIEDPSDSSQRSLLHQLTPPLLALARPTPQLSFPPPSLPSICPPITSVLGAIHVRALECLNNLFVGMKERESLPANGDEKDEIIQGAVGVWNQMWSAELLGAVGPPPPGTGSSTVSSGKVGKSAVQPGTEKKVEIWNISVGVLWGLARMSRGSLVPNEEQVKILMSLCDSTTDEKCQVQCIGTLGCLAQCQSAVGANLMISKYLGDLLTRGTSTLKPTAGIESALQAASSLIDIFADENSAHDSNFRELKLQKTISDGAKGAKKLIKSIDVKKPGGRALRGWANGVIEDMSGFVEYRRKLGR